MSGNLPPPSPPSSPGNNGNGPQAKKRTYADRKTKALTSPIRNGGFTTRLPCPVNVTVQAQPNTTNTNARGTYLAPLKDLSPRPRLCPSPSRNFDSTLLEYIREIKVFSAEEMRLLESLGNPLEMDITHPNFKALFGGTLQRANIPMESFVDCIPVLPSNPEKYFTDLRLALSYEMFKKMEDEGQLAEIFDQDFDNNGRQGNMSSLSAAETEIAELENSEEEDSAPSTSEHDMETLLCSNGAPALASPPSKPSQKSDSSVVEEIRKLAEKLLYYKSNRSKYGKFVLKPSTSPHLFLRIPSKATAELVGVPIGTYIQKAAAEGFADNSEPDSDFMVRLAQLIVSQGASASIIRDVSIMSVVKPTAHRQPPEERVETKRRNSTEKVLSPTEIEKPAAFSNDDNLNSSKTEANLKMEAKSSGVDESSNDVDKIESSQGINEIMPRLCRVEELWSFPEPSTAVQKNVQTKLSSSA